MDRRSPTRRALLRDLPVGSTVALAAGCSGLSEEPAAYHEVTVVNTAFEAHTYRVRITGETGDVLAAEDIDLPEDKVDGFTFPGSPAAVDVRIDERELREFRWEPTTDDTFESLHPN